MYFILRFVCDDVMKLTENSAIDNDVKSVDHITLNTYDIHENVS